MPRDVSESIGDVIGVQLRALGFRCYAQISAAAVFLPAERAF
jgi:hypothetical protein